MARQFKNDHRAKSIRARLAYMQRTGNKEERMRAHLIDIDLEELLTMADEEIERLEARYACSPITSDGYLAWLDDDFDDDDESADND